MEKIKVKQVSARHAAGVMSAACLTDPARRATPESIAAAGDCFELDTPAGKAVFVLEKNDRRAWISGAGSVGSTGVTGSGLAVIERMAVQGGCASVAFQTGRPGLVRLAKRQGYRVVGFIMEKSV